MDETRKSTTDDLGVFARRGRSVGLSSTEIIALALSALWLLGVTVFFFVVGRSGMEVSGPGQVLMIVVGVFLPLALIWIATTAATSARVVREETARLQASMDAIRQAYVADRQKGSSGVSPQFERKIDELMAAQRQTDAALATFSSIRPDKPAIGPAEPGVAPVDPGDQPALALGTSAEDMIPPISVDDFIKALNFPETAEDKEGFRALRRAMQDRRAAELIQASQDVLTLLSQEGIYMDDLRPDRARPEVWRRFAKGERGRTVAGLGGIRDRSGIALSAARMRQDHIFRDTVHHFLRKFDKVFAEFEENATDLEIEALADTRSARAFMLLGRVAGTFN
jgi:hypothetical protein